MIPVVLSGGSGARLWPVSRESYPKQFCEFFDRSFLRLAVDRAMKLGPPRIVTLSTMKALTVKSVADLKLPSSAFVLEPIGKNTAAAIGLIVHILTTEGRGDEIMAVLPADHLIADQDSFLSSMRLAEKVAFGGAVVTIGIEPRYAATGYGYLQIERSSTAPAKSRELEAHPVSKFFEKPSKEQAEKYLKTGLHFWNAGVFVFKVNTMQELLNEHMPDLAAKLKTLKSDLSNLKYVYANIIAQSIDYGVIEKMSGPLFCIPCDCGWSDVGSWDELARLSDEEIKIDSKAVVRLNEAKNNFVYTTQGKVVGLCGVNNLIVVDTPDALLVTERGQSQKVKNLVANMREAGQPQVDEHMFEVRPWGGFEILADQPDHKVKRLSLDPGAQMSYQMHARRDEHWVVVSGDGEVISEGKVEKLRAGQQFFAPRGQKHRLRNSGKQKLIILEIQTGEYFGEDDIERFADDYDRI